MDQVLRLTPDARCRALPCLFLALGLAACGPPHRTPALLDTLEQERTAHLETDANLLASVIDDSLVAVQAGRVIVETREQVRANFEAYFDEATYDLWDDLEPLRITLSTDGGTAWVARRVKVSRSAQRFGLPQIEDFESSWVATYRWDGERWLMTSNASGVAEQLGAVLAGASRAVGNPEVINGVQQLNFHAAVSGPGGAFEVDVTSTRDGRALLAFTPGMSMGIEADRSWRTIDGTEVEPISPEELEFVRGHELLMRVVAPTTRFPSLSYGGQTFFDGQPSLRLTGVDRLGGAVEAHYAVADTSLLGFRVEDHLRGAGTVTASLSDWRSVEGLRLPHRATFVQGSETFDYELSAIEVLGEVIEASLVGPEYTAPIPES